MCKLGCIYFILRDLPPKLISVLMNIHLVALFHSEDLKKYGFDPILKPLVDNLKIRDRRKAGAIFRHVCERFRFFKFTFWIC